jgi:hypothetical protein
MATGGCSGPQRGLQCRRFFHHNRLQIALSKVVWCGQASGFVWR